MAIQATTIAAAGSAAYAVLALVRPDHIGDALAPGTADPERARERYRGLARALGVRDLAVSALVLGARTPAARTAGALVRVAVDLGDAVLLPRLAGTSRTRRVIVAVTLTSAALHALAIVHDRRTAG